MAEMEENHANNVSSDGQEEEYDEILTPLFSGSKGMTSACAV